MNVQAKLKMCGACALLVASLCVLAPTGAASVDNEDVDKKAKSLASYTMGVVYDLQGATQKAIEEYEKSADYDDNYASHLRLGTDYARMGMVDQAVAELQSVLKKDANNVQARYLLALIYSSQKEFDKAAVEYEAILKTFSKAQPENKEIYGYLGQLYYSQKEYKKAIDQFEIILSLDPGNADVVFLLGSLYLEQGDQQKAEEYFLRCTKAAPKNDGCLNSLGYLYAEQGTKLDEAQKLVESAVTLDQNIGAYMDSLGWVYFKKGEYEKALFYLQQASRMIEDPVIFEHIGDVYMKIQKPEDAKKYWQQSLDLLPGQNHVIEKIKELN